jgi:predicted Zn-dependent protease
MRRSFSCLRRRVVVPDEHLKQVQWKPILVFGGSALLAGSWWYYQSHMEAVPISGRQRFINLSMRTERMIGASSFEQLLQQTPKNKIVRGELPRKILEIVERLAENSGYQALSELKWKVLVIDDPTPNAFVLPGGYVCVYTGILPICKNIDGLATVLSHEVSHVLARHGAERMSETYTFFVPIFVLLSLFGDWGSARVFQGLFSVLVQLPNSRTHESEADALGVHLMAKSCYNVHESVRFWDRFDKAMKGQNSTPEFLSTHPNSSTRRDDLIQLMPEVDQERAKYCT